jgi:1-acyl-sn-glycerol-3-phosphate acyltransferase
LELFLIGVAYISYEKKNYDYSKYLGPDWKPTFKNPSTIVANHSGYLDIILAGMYKFPGFVAKEGIKNWPIINAMGLGSQPIWLSRTLETKDEREKQVI